MIVPVALSVGLATSLPPVAASYQTTVEPLGAVAVAVSVWMGDVSHSVWSPPETGAAGNSLINTVAVF